MQTLFNIDNAAASKSGRQAPGDPPLKFAAGHLDDTLWERNVVLPAVVHGGEGGKVPEDRCTSSSMSPTIAPGAALLEAMDSQSANASTVHMVGGPVTDAPVDSFGSVFDFL